MMDEWIKQLRAGDKVYISTGFSGGLQLTTVKKITPKGHVRTTGGSLYRDGCCKIDSWTSKHLQKWTQELEDKMVAKAHFNKLAHSINAIDARTLTSEQVHKIYDIIKEGHET